MFWNKNNQLNKRPVQSKLQISVFFYWFWLNSTFFSRKRLRMTLENGKNNSCLWTDTIKYFENDNLTFTNLKQSQSKILITLFTWIEKENFKT